MTDKTTMVRISFKQLKALREIFPEIEGETLTSYFRRLNHHITKNLAQIKGVKYLK